MAGLFASQEPRQRTPSMAERLGALKQNLTPQDSSRAANVAKLLTEGVLGALPGSGDVMAARDSQRAGSQMAERLREGNYGGAVASGAEALLNGIGVLPMIPALGGVIKAYHGSPHRFSKFSMDKLGTGEGAQAFGSGLYFAESPDVARSYLNAGTPSSAGSRQKQIVSDALASSADEKSARALIHQQAMDLPPNQRQTYFDAYNNFDGIKESGPSSFYEVTLTPDHDDLLDWDAPLSEQSPKVRSVLDPKQLDRRMSDLRAEDAGLGGLARPDASLESLLDDAFSGVDVSNSLTKREAVRKAEIASEMQTLEIARRLHEANPGFSGGELYQNLMGVMRSPEAASQALREAGIPGIRYLDAGSRSAKEGTRNIVMFDDSLVNIDRVE